MLRSPSHYTESEITVTSFEQDHETFIKASFSQRTSWIGLIQIQAKNAKYDNVQVEIGSKVVKLTGILGSQYPGPRELY